VQEGEAFALGLLQGIAEFLPISSSGHLNLLSAALGLEEPAVATNLMLHLATLLVILVAFRKTIAAWLFPFQTDIWLRLLLTSIPTAIIGLGLKKGCGDLLGSATWSSLFLCINGLGLIALAKILNKGQGQDQLRETPTIQQSLWIGVAQGLAALPGISRSGSTIGLARLMGIAPRAAAEYSLIASVPVIAGATLLECRDLSQFDDLNTIAFAALVAALSGWFSIKYLLKLVDRNAWMGWGIYCIAMGLGYGVWSNV
jgi:undecaprenyl-diphosphatase